MTRITKTHQIDFVVRSALRQRLYVVNKICRNASSLCKAVFTKRVTLNVTIAYLSPIAAVSLAAVIPSLKAVVVTVHQLFVFLAVHIVGQL